MRLMVSGLAGVLSRRWLSNPDSKPTLTPSLSHTHTRTLTRPSAFAEATADRTVDRAAGQVGHSLPFDGRGWSRVGGTGFYGGHESQFQERWGEHAQELCAGRGQCQRVFSQRNRIRGGSERENSQGGRAAWELVHPITISHDERSCKCPGGG